MCLWMYSAFSRPLSLSRSAALVTDSRSTTASSRSSLATFPPGFTRDVYLVALRASIPSYRTLPRYLIAVCPELQEAICFLRCLKRVTITGHLLAFLLCTYSARIPPTAVTSAVIAVISAGSSLIVFSLPLLFQFVDPFFQLLNVPLFLSVGNGFLLRVCDEATHCEHESYKACGRSEYEG